MRTSPWAAAVLSAAALASGGCPAPTPPVDAPKAGAAPAARPTPPTDPRTADQLTAAGLEHGRKGELIDAIAAFEAALVRDPKHVSAQFNLGVSFLELDRPIEAEKAFAAFVALRPDDVTGRFALARTQAAIGHVDDALASLERAVQLGFDDPVALKGGGFQRLEGDLRYLALQATVAQRAAVAGRPVEDDDFAREGSKTNYGGITVPGLKLPGVRNAGDCKRLADGAIECKSPP